MAHALLPDATMSCRPGLCAIILGILLASGVGTESPAPSAMAEAGCPAYVVHLRNARTALERGNRGAAIAELRLAHEALRSCQQKQGESEIGLAARDRLPRA